MDDDMGRNTAYAAGAGAMRKMMDLIGALSFFGGLAEGADSATGTSARFGGIMTPRRRSPRRYSRSPLSAVLASAFLLFNASASAQQPAQGAVGGRLNVFLTCETPECDLGGYQGAVGWVNWVGAANDAEISVTISGDGSMVDEGAFTLDFEPVNSPDLSPDQLIYTVREGDAAQQGVDGIATLLNIGLARYATIVGFKDFVSIRPALRDGIDPTDRIVSAQEVDDPWNLWTFRIGGSGNISGQETRKTNRYNYTFSANRTTPTWKVGFNGRGNVNIREIERSDGSLIETDQRDWNFNANVTYTLAEHWSLRASSSSGVFPNGNQDFREEIQIGAEYSIFPYEEATRQAIIVRYTFGPTYRNYEELSIFGKLEETAWEQSFQLRAAMRQPWGDASSTITASHLLEDIKKHNLSLRGNLSFRIVRGLSLNTGGNVSWVTDQIYISANGATDEEILLRLRTRASSFNYGMNIGFSYQFGSIYNNTVNNRFAGAPGGSGGGAAAARAAAARARRGGQP